jgi:hypothetical protein
MTVALPLPRSIAERFNRRLTNSRALSGCDMRLANRRRASVCDLPLLLEKLSRPAPREAAFSSLSPVALSFGGFAGKMRPARSYGQLNRRDARR